MYTPHVQLCLVISSDHGSHLLVLRYFAFRYTKRLKKKSGNFRRERQNTRLPNFICSSVKTIRTVKGKKRNENTLIVSLEAAHRGKKAEISTLTSKRGFVRSPRRNNSSFYILLTQ